MLKVLLKIYVSMILLFLFYNNNSYIIKVIISLNKSLDICAQSYNLSKEQTISLTFFSVSHADENMLIKLIEDYSNEKLIMVFDAARENFRNEIYPEYKANRRETPEDLIPQFELIRKCVKPFNVPQL